MSVERKNYFAFILCCVAITTIDEMDKTTSALYSLAKRKNWVQSTKSNTWVIFVISKYVHGKIEKKIASDSKKQNTAHRLAPKCLHSDLFWANSFSLSIQIKSNGRYNWYTNINEPNVMTGYQVIVSTQPWMHLVRSFCLSFSRVHVIGLYARCLLHCRL